MPYLLSTLSTGESCVLPAISPIAVHQKTRFVKRTLPNRKTTTKSVPTKVLVWLFSKTKLPETRIIYVSDTRTIYVSQSKTIYVSETWTIYLQKKTYLCTSIYVSETRTIYHIRVRNKAHICVANKNHICTGKDQSMYQYLRVRNKNHIPYMC